VGSDDIHKKRGKNRALQRKRVVIQRQASKRILVLCEGETEDIYIKTFAKPYKDKIVVEASAKCPTCPVGMADKAIELKEQDGDFDAIFLVFDNDVVTPEKMAKIDELADVNNLHLVKSDPCFEYWLLLHFKFTRKPYKRLPNKSPCDQVVSELRKISGMESYNKAAEINLSLLMSKTDTAIKFAERSIDAWNSEGQSNPSTNMHELIACICDPSSYFEK